MLLLQNTRSKAGQGTISSTIPTALLTSFLFVVCTFLYKNAKFCCKSLVNFDSALMKQKVSNCSRIYDSNSSNMLNNNSWITVIINVHG